MENIYEATGEQKREIIDIENIDLIIRKQWGQVYFTDLVLVRTTNIFPVDGIVQPIDVNIDTKQKSSNWTINGANLSGKDFVIVEPFEEQVNNPSLANISESDTWFNGNVQLSKKAIILIQESRYRELCKENPSFKSEAKKYNIALYRGDENFALKMLLLNKRFASFDLDENGFIQADEYGDTLEYINQLKNIQNQIAVKLQEQGQHVTYGLAQQFYESRESIDKARTVENVSVKKESDESLSSKMITGQTKMKEGDIELDKTCYASIGIGKIRDNQEDAVLLIKDENNPNFKMMVVADGMGGEQQGEVASHIIVSELKQWFENLSEAEKATYYTDVSRLNNILKEKIQEISDNVGNKLMEMRKLGGATLVCAIVGKDNTLIANVGDSRAYIISNGKLEQVTIDDAIVQEEFEKGNIPNKDAMRFHTEAAGITQCLGMGKIEHIHSRILNNNEYDMLLLFSDGVTDCLSDEDIAVICKNTDRKKTAKMLAQKAIEHDSIGPEVLYEEYADFNLYVPGGKDNTTSVAYIPKKQGDNEER